MWTKLSVVVIILALGHANADSDTSYEGFIVGGESATIEEFPYQVSVQYNNFHTCGGAIIDSTTILTSAHCLVGRIPSQFSVRAGSAYNTIGGVHIAASRIIFHPLFDDISLDNDIGIIKLGSELVFDETIDAVDLPYLDPELVESTLLTISGWGQLEVQGPYPEQLQKADIPHVDIEACQAAYAEWPGVIDVDRQICAGGDEVDSCIGDYGGALVINNTAIGLSSWANSCALPDFPTVHARVSYHLDWIISYLD